MTHVRWLRLGSGLVAALLLCGVMVTPAQAQLVGLYRFEDANPGKDSSPLGNDLTAFGGVAFDPNGKYGQGLLLNGLDAVLAIPDPVLGGINEDAVPNQFPVGHSSYTLAAWVNTSVSANQNGGQMGIIGWGDYGNVGRVDALRLKSDGIAFGAGIRHYWWGNDLDFNDTNDVDFSDGTYHHIAATYDVLANMRQLYVDGQLKVFGSPGTAHARAAEFRLGRTCSFCGQGEYFQGTLDDVAIFTQALTVDQIQKIMTGDFSDFGGP